MQLIYLFHSWKLGNNLRSTMEETENIYLFYKYIRIRGFCYCMCSYCISQRETRQSSEAAANTPTQLSLGSRQKSNFTHNIATVPVQEIIWDFDSLPEPDFALATVIFSETVRLCKHSQKPPNCQLTETRATGGLEKVGNQVMSVYCRLRSLYNLCQKKSRLRHKIAQKACLSWCLMGKLAQ